MSGCEIITLGSWEGHEIATRPEDGYINATQMCQANGRLWADFWRLEQTQRFAEEFALDMGIPISKLVITRRGKPASLQGTWIHRRLAIKLAAWVSAKFEVWVIKQIDTLLTTGVVSVHKEHSEHILATVSEVLVGVQRNHEVLIAGHVQQTERLERVESKVDGLSERLNRVERRQQPSQRCRRRHVAAVHARGGNCPCCHTVQIVSEDRQVVNGGEVDHFGSVSDASPTQTWLICRACNLRLRDPVERGDAKSDFESYQRFRKRLEDNGQKEFSW